MFAQAVCRLSLNDIRYLGMVQLWLADGTAARKAFRSTYLPM
jgi:hypothetical protein